jgi:hypothetical protein
VLTRIAIAGVVALLLAPTGSKAASDKAIEAARASFSKCQQQHVADVSVAYSDPNDAALALTNRCRDEYAALVKRIAQREFDTSNERRMFGIDKNSDWMKVDASLPVIEKHRQFVATTREPEQRKTVPIM